MTAPCSIIHFQLVKLPMKVAIEIIRQSSLDIWLCFWAHEYTVHPETSQPRVGLLLLL